jgi:hypothetical protein
MYAPAIGRASLTERTVLAGREVFLGRRRGPLAMLPFVGPAVIASIAYMDPGNFARISRLAQNMVTNFCGSRSPPISSQGDLVAFLASLTSADYTDQGTKELARQREISLTKRPQRDTARAFGPKPPRPEPPGP